MKIIILITYTWGGNGDSKNNTDVEELDNENLPSRIQEEIKKQEEKQKIFLKQNKQNIIDFINNKESIRIEDLKISEPFYKCYREKGNCQICNTLTNILCTNSCNNHKEIWLCTNHWKQHAIVNHHQNR